MKHKKGKTINYYMRSLHRDIGFLVVGLTIIFSISGIILIYRDTDFLKKEKQVEKTLAPNMQETELRRALHLRKFRILKDEKEIIYFPNGTYNKETGAVKYSAKELPAFLNKFNGLHRASSRNILHWASLVYGILLMFLAVSSFWMYKPKTKMFRRGTAIASIGIVLAGMLLFF